MTTFDLDPDEILRVLTALDNESIRLEDLNSRTAAARADECIALATRIRVESRRPLGAKQVSAESHRLTDSAAQRYVNGLNAFEAQRPVESWHLAEAKRLGKPEPTNGATVVFTVDKPGRRFTRIVSTWTNGGNRSAHAFVENATGHVYKAAGWKAPDAEWDDPCRAEHVRFTTVEGALARAAEHPLQAFAGGYLYMR